MPSQSTNPYSELLLRGAAEVRSYQLSGRCDLPAVYFDSLVSRLQAMAEIAPGPALNQQIDALGRIMVDEYPLTDNFAPAITQVLDTQQRLERHLRRDSSKRK